MVIYEHDTIKMTHILTGILLAEVLDVSPTILLDTGRVLTSLECNALCMHIGIAQAEFSYMTEEHRLRMMITCPCGRIFSRDQDSIKPLCRECRLTGGPFRILTAEEDDHA